MMEKLLERNGWVRKGSRSWEKWGSEEWRRVEVVCRCVCGVRSSGASIG